MKRRYADLLNLIIKRWWMLVLIAMLATFSLLLFMGLGQSIWFDEGYSILLAKRPLTELIALTNVDAHPPLYYILLKAWAGIFGWSELALRSMSALLTAGVVGVAALLVRRLFSTRIALVALPFLVFAPFLLRYGYEVRMYALASLIGIAGTYVFVRALNEKTNKRLWISYGILVALGMYTLYMTLVIWLAHAVWLFVTLKQKKHVFKQPFIVGYITAITVFLPQLPVFIDQTLHSALPGVGTELTLTKLVSVLGVMTIYASEWQIGGWLSLLLAVAAIMFGMIYAAVVNDGRYRQGLLFISVLLIVPIVFYALSSLPPRQPIFIERYMAHVSVYFYLLIALVAVLGFLGKRKKLSFVFTGIVIVIMATGVIRLQSTGNLNLERMQLPETKQLRSNIPCDMNTTIVADDPYTYIDSAYYFEGCNMVFYSKDPIGFRGGYALLYDSAKRVGTADDLVTSQIIHLHWDGVEPSFTPGASYRFVSSQTYGKQVVTIYKR